MNRTEHLLTQAAEECAEIAQRCSKALRFGLLEVQEGQLLTNAQRIVNELQDLEGVVEMLQEDALLPDLERQAIIAKKAKVEQYLAYAEKCGTLTKVCKCGHAIRPNMFCQMCGEPK